MTRVSGSCGEKLTLPYPDSRRRLPGLDDYGLPLAYRTDGVQRIAHEGFEVSKPVCLAAKDQDGYSAMPEILLVRDFLISSDDHIESRRLCRGQQRAVLQTREPRIGRCTAIVICEEMAERLVHAFIQQ